MFTESVRISCHLTACPSWLARYHTCLIFYRPRLLILTVALPNWKLSCLVISTSCHCYFQTCAIMLLSYQDTLACWCLVLRHNSTTGCRIILHLLILTVALPNWKLSCLVISTSCHCYFQTCAIMLLSYQDTLACWCLVLRHNSTTGCRIISTILKRKLACHKQPLSD